MIVQFICYLFTVSNYVHCVKNESISTLTPTLCGEFFSKFDFCLLFFGSPPLTSQNEEMYFIWQDDKAVWTCLCIHNELFPSTAGLWPHCWLLTRSVGGGPGSHMPANTPLVTFSMQLMCFSLGCLFSWLSLQGKFGCWGILSYLKLVMDVFYRIHTF